MSVESIKTRAKKKKPTSPWHKRYRVLIIIMVAFFLMVVTYAAATSLQNYNEANDARQKMTTYLNNKYGKKFVVENYRVEGDGFAVEGDPTADAYPEENSALRFEIWDRGRFKEGQHAYSDDLVNAIWSAEQTKVVAGELEKIMGYKPDYKVMVGFGGKFETYKTLPSFDEALDKNSSKMSFQLDIYPRERIDAQSRSLHSGRVFQLVNLLKMKGVRATLTYISKDKKSGVYFENDQLQSIDSVQVIENEMKERK